MKTLQFFTFLMAVASIYSCNSSKKPSDEAMTNDSASDSIAYSLAKKWESDTLLTTVESVIYDKNKQVLYASCISGAADAKDKVGFVAQLDLEGNITNAGWITGLDAPKGMAIVGNSLFVTDIDEIAEIDIENGKIINTYPVDGAEFLNDAVSDAEGNVYVSDSRTHKLYLLSDGAVTVYADSIQSPNGLFVDGSKLITAFWDDQKISSIDMESMEVTDIAGGLENPDGIEAVGDGGYLVSSWNGKVHYVSPEGEVTLLLDTSGEEISSADIEYIPELKLLLVPTFFANSVAAYELRN